MVCMVWKGSGRVGYYLYKMTESTVMLMTRRGGAYQNSTVGFIERSRWPHATATRLPYSTVMLVD